MEDIFTSDEETNDLNSTKYSGVTVEDSSAEEGTKDGNESIVFVRKGKTGVQRIDSDTDDDEAERRAFSPKTRRSITGIYRSHFFTDSEESSSEINYSDEETNVPKKTESIVISENPSFIEESNVAEISNSLSTEESSFIEKSAKSVNSNNEPIEEESSYVEQSTKAVNMSVLSEKSFNKTATSNNRTKTAVHDNIEPRYTSNFNQSAENLLSSTIFEDPNVDAKTSQENCFSSSDSSNDVQVTSVKSMIFELSSTDESLSAVEPELVQPNIRKAFAEKPPPLKPPRSAKKTPIEVVKKFVSQEFYDKECQKLMELKQELQSAESLAEKVSNHLPDGGRNLLMRCDRLKLDIDIKSKYIESLAIEREKSTSNTTKKPPVSKILNWDDLSNAVNKVQPIHTGVTGMKTFNQQKALTAERLKDLHGSLESRPNENEMAENPEGLKVDLMPHQRHALKWMEWREKQNPRGGILADDMGLGKTLSMISLVLAAKNRRDINGNDDSDSSDDDNGPWNSKGRRTKYSGGTLVLCPASLIMQWEHEVKCRVSSNRLTVLVHHGTNRHNKPKHLRTYDIVLTTYKIAAIEHKNEGALFGLKWRRIILDEGHIIRNHKAQLSVAACELNGSCRWVLTGTPVHNKEMDVYALLKFLRCTPFDDLVYWKRWIDKSAGGQERMQAVMQTLLLRRMKAVLLESGNLNCLPEKELKIVKVSLQTDEMNVYQKVMVYSRTLFAQFLYQRAERNSDLYFVQDAARPTYLQSKDPNGAYIKLHEKFKLMNKNSNEVRSHEILTLLLRLRQICCHPGLIDAMLEDDVDSNSSSEQNSTQPEIDLLNELNKLTVKDSSDDLNDSLHELALAKASAKVLQRGNPVFNLNRASSKIVKILETVQQILSSTTDKAIIVSQWTSFLTIVKAQMKKLNIATVAIDGSVPVKNRQSIMDEFNNPSRSTRIMLLSLTAGGVGLNLVGANHLLLIDLHWNPQLESQAQDRIYRVGQKKTVKVYKFVCVDTVEERIKALQDNKLSIANSVLDGTKAAKGSQLTIDDLKGLFAL